LYEQIVNEHEQGNSLEKDYLHSVLGSQSFLDDTLLISASFSFLSPAYL